MKKTYLAVVNERYDTTIAGVVKKLFTKYNGEVPIQVFRDRIRQKLGYNPLQIIKLEKMPLRVVEREFRGNAYRVLDDIVYQKDTEL